MGPADTPDDVPLGFTLALDKAGGFTGQEAARRAQAAPRARRVIPLAVDDPEASLLHDEALLHEGRIVGRVTRGSDGFTLGRACGTGLVSVDVPEGSDRTVDCGGVLVQAETSTRPFYDPAGHRRRS